MNLKKIGNLLTSKSVGTGPSSYEKRMYRAAVSQSLRNTDLKGKSDSVMPQRHTRGEELYHHSFSNSVLGGVVNFTPRPLYHREITLVYIEQKSGWTPGSIWTLRRREKSLTTIGFRIPDRPPLCLVPFTTFNL